MNRGIPFLFILFPSMIVGCSQFQEKPTLGEIYLRPVDEMVMVYVLPGEFQMGSNEDEINSAFDVCTDFWDNCDYERFIDEQPLHTVVIDGFWIDRTEVTNEQYQKCVETKVCEEPMCWSGSQFNDLDQPVVCVTWYQARSYCDWVGGRLPTEAEWEYVARGPTGLLYPWGNAFEGANLNYCDATCGRPRSDIAYNDGQLYSAPVGSYPVGASWCGALDMAGNVSEWVADWYGTYDPKMKVNPLGSVAGYSRVIRGGSWFLTRVEARTTWREGILPDNWFDDLGFRCVIPAIQKE